MMERAEQRISTLSQIPLMRKMSNVKILITGNRNCGQLLRCIWSPMPEQNCSNDMGQLCRNCDSNAFQEKLIRGNSYDFLKGNHQHI
mmetsp:Transcript_105926/g.210572  ORF Transcript_105926/g.210572 Transcript_105926/m.210572 type:complete len:87 (+) Transcript_105926:228-488(+)